MAENIDPTEINLGAEEEALERQELVVVIAKNLADGSITVETDQGEIPAGDVEEALEIARTTLEGTTPEGMRDEVAAEVYPEEGTA
jgi:hypothetical protein